ncbi:hypothetical protein FN846DRAFT_174551 [Sphaerosporella brunnea]|uniref:Transmembrane protein n=1 Tax=Sphaerosporella brunnea TaxID=1250544 RepID=A0A5J5EP52_9PEZI|nr:hypothetical protein FN846DRAFT_174551 [Sphaerosporella brunnea]
MGYDDKLSHSDLAVSSLAWGFTIGFGVLTTWEAIKQTTRARDPLRSTYIWLVWGEILMCMVIGLIVYLLFSGFYEVSLTFLIWLLILWSLKLHFVIQIIVNRISLITSDPSFNRKLKWGAAFAITCLNISVFCIWIPAQLEVSKTYEHINKVWDRMTKIIYLAIDMTLNWIFIRTVKERLVKQGIVKYDELVTFNIRIIFISLAMDLLILGAMSFKNPLVYTQFHPVAFIVKLRIELSMAKLIRKIAVEKPLGPFELPPATGFSGKERNKVTAMPTRPPFVVPHAGFKSRMLDNPSTMPGDAPVRERVDRRDDDEDSLRNNSWQMRMLYHAKD